MIDLIRDWGLLIGALGGPFVTWLILTRTNWFKGNTVKAEEEAKQIKALAQAKTREAIEAINRGDAGAYGEMLGWMQTMLKEQASQHDSVRKMLEETITRLRTAYDNYGQRIEALSAEVAELRGRDTQCQRELGEMRVMITQQSMTHREEAGAIGRAAEKLGRENKILRRQVYELGGDPTKTITMDEAS